VIANSLSITIAQRTREFATLRTLGASRRQVLRSIMLEALVVGVARSVVGSSSASPRQGSSPFRRRRFTLPNNGLTSRPDDRGALIVGIVVTLLASLRPRARDARPADRRRARGRDAPESRSRASARRPDRLTVLGFARSCSRALRPTSARRRSCCDGVGRCSSSSASRSRPPGSGAARRRSAGRRRKSAGAGRARPRQRAAQPAAHALDGVGADDRARARHARRVLAAGSTRASAAR
jgi:hypothetical protein